MQTWTATAATGIHQRLNTRDDTARPRIRTALLIGLIAGAIAAASAQGGQSPYVPDPDPLVRQKIDEWQDLKLGLLMHWGTYSQWGIVESWSLCAEDEDWCRRKGPFADDYEG